MFKDRVILDLRAGSGGHGIVAWRREKYIPKGGPAGGDGGEGGSIYLEASEHQYCLDSYRNRALIQAENGRSGAGACQKGRSGKDIILPVPLGTLVKDVSTQEVLFDLVEPNQKALIARGGRGGLGNIHFKSSTNRAPYKCTEGVAGETCKVELELKLIADVGLVGFPNAGKSTLFKQITHVDAKIGAYPFTTLNPQIGFVNHDFDKRYCVADIPGIVKGASENKGLGLEFLRHIERTSFLVYVLDASQESVLEDFLTLREEVRSYHQAVYQKPFIVFLNKTDLPESEDHVQLFIDSKTVDSDVVYTGSANTQEGLERLSEVLLSKTQGASLYAHQAEGHG